MISVCINTRNRPTSLEMCLTNILKNNFKNFEIIIVDQSDNPQGLPKRFLRKNIKYIIDDKKGAGRAKNIAIKKARGNILAFTDDDCIVAKNWLEKINTIFSKHSDISGIFGKVMSYKPSTHRNEICPSIVTKVKTKTVNRPCLHWKYLGYGNNMAFRKNALAKSGNFKNWLGPGSVGKNADDAGATLGLLVNHNKLMYNPQVKVWHNRWLSKTEFHDQKLAYIFGELACYGYFFFQGYKFAKPIIKNSLKDLYYRLRKILKKIILFKWDSKIVIEIKSTGIETIYKTRGLLVGLLYSVIDPISK